MDHLSKGKEGEEKAIAYLLNQGIEIIERNYRAGKFELDIIARLNSEKIMHMAIQSIL
jgi:putative endonuclease